MSSPALPIRTSRRQVYATWIFSLLVLTVLIVVVLRFGELSSFAELARNAQPQWLFLSLFTQAATYFAAAAVWHRALSALGESISFAPLVPLGLAKLFTDQAVPSGGISGTMLLIGGLARRGVSAEVVTQTLLVALVSFYSAYLLAATVAFGVLWLHHQANAALVGAAAVFCLVAISVPVVVLGMKRWGQHVPSRWLEQLPAFAALFERVADAPTRLLRNSRLIASSFCLQLSVFLLDTMTFWIVFRALGHPVEFLVVFVSFMMASVLATIGPVPFGAGVFEAGSVAMLGLLGVEVEPALAATLLLRGLTFWLPMLPGLWLARREIRGT